MDRISSPLLPLSSIAAAAYADPIYITNYLCACLLVRTAAVSKPLAEEKVYFASPNLHKSLIFLLQLQNRTYELLQLFKTGQLSSLTGLRLR